MKLFHYTGESDVAAPFLQVLAGTGQSGAIGIASANGWMEKNAALQWNQLTSSGEGSVRGDFGTTGMKHISRFRCLLRWMITTVDAGWDAIELTFTIADGTNIHYFGINLESAYGATEEVQYYADSSAWVDSGLTWITSNNANTGLWRELDFMVDLADAKYEYINYEGETSYDTLSLDKSPSAAEPRIKLNFYLHGKDSQIYMGVSEMLWEGWTS